MNVGKITKSLFSLSGNLKVELMTMPNYPSKGTNKYNYGIGVSKALDTPRFSDKVNYINIVTGDFLVLNYKDSDSNFKSIMFSYHNMYKLKRCIHDMINRLSNTFIEVDDKMVVDADNDFTLELEGVTENVVIQFQPDIIDGIVGVNYFFNDDNLTGFIKLDNIIGFYDFLKNFDLLNASLSLLNTAETYRARTQLNSIKIK